jgi:hypothetical protein
MQKVNVAPLNGLSYQIGPSGDMLLTDAANEKIIQQEEYLRSALLLAIDEAVGGNWKLEFVESTPVLGVRNFDVYIVAPDPASYNIMANIIKDRLTREYTMNGRYPEYSGITFHFQFFDRSPVHSYLQYDCFSSLPVELLYASMMDD